ncbi:putative glycosyltransferase [Gemmatimonas aurantiaca T-27]|nr:putative glycosyltransferase [Gemmatimonas aurantiaca T-27]
MPAHIAFVANRLPWPLDDGWKRRTFAIAQATALLGDLTIVVPRGTWSDTIEFENAFGADCRIVFSDGPNPLSVGEALTNAARFNLSPLACRHLDPSLVEALVSVAHHRRLDAVVYAGAFLAERHQQVPALRDVPFCIDTHNLDSLALGRRAKLKGGLMQAPLRLSARLQQRAERRVFGQAAKTVVCSATEVPLAKDISPNANVGVVANGVDLSEFVAAPLPERTDICRLLFFGNLEYPPNVDAVQMLVDDLMPRIRSRGLPGHCRIVGAGRPSAIAAMVAGLDDVSLVGQVPKIVDEIHAADIIVVPLRAGGGTRLKIVEALACARPIVTTRIGAEGLALDDGETALLRDDADTFVDAVEALWNDEKLAGKIAENASRFATSRYAWQGLQKEFARQVGEVL